MAIDYMAGDGWLRLILRTDSVYIALQKFIPIHFYPTIYIDFSQIEGQSVRFSVDGNVEGIEYTPAPLGLFALSCSYIHRQRRQKSSSNREAEIILIPLCKERLFEAANSNTRAYRRLISCVHLSFTLCTLFLMDVLLCFILCVCVIRQLFAVRMEFPSFVVPPFI